MLKKIILFMVLVLLLVSCAEKETETQEEDFQVPDLNPVVTETDSETITPEDIKTVQKKDMPDDAAKVLNSLHRITSFSYIDRSGDNEKTTDNEIHVKGTRLRITTNKPNEFKVGDLQYDTIYVDRVAEKAYGTCQSKLCDKELYKKYKEVDYNVFNPVTPLARIREVDYAEINEDTTKMVEDAVLIPLEADGLTYWVHNYYGLPYEITKGDQTVYRYDNIVLNRVSDDDVILPASYAKLE